MGWDGFWIAIAIAISVEEIISFLKWRTKKLYGIEEEEKKLVDYFKFKKKKKK